MNAASEQAGDQAESSIAPGRRFAWLVAAHGVSTCGNYLNLVALALFTYQVTGSGLGVGLLAALRLVTGSLAGFAAGALAERFDRRRLMIGADLAQVVAMTATHYRVRCLPPATDTISPLTWPFAAEPR